MRVLRLLAQDKVWTDNSGTEHKIVSMDHRYRSNVENFLLRRAKNLAVSVSMEYLRMPMPDVYSEAFDSISSEIEHEMDEATTDPEKWLNEQPLLKALRTGCPERVWRHRHQPYGCAACGMNKRGHKAWSPTYGTHNWEAPADWMIKARMRARKAKTWGDRVGTN